MKKLKFISKIIIHLKQIRKKMRVENLDWTFIKLGEE